MGEGHSRGINSGFTILVNHFPITDIIDQEGLITFHIVENRSLIPDKPGCHRRLPLGDHFRIIGIEDPFIK